MKKGVDFNENFLDRIMIVSWIILVLEFCPALFRVKNEYDKNVKISK